jgi:hypothetical protein
LNHSIARAFPVSVALYPGILRALRRGQGRLGLDSLGSQLRSRDLEVAALGGKSVQHIDGGTIRAFGYIALLIVVFSVWALRLYSDAIARGAA